MPDTATVRSRRYRERKAGRLPPPTPLICSSCGANHTGIHGDLCSRCWERLTPEGRRAKADRVARSRAKRKRNDL